MKVEGPKENQAPSERYQPNPVISGKYNPVPGSEASDACIDCEQGYACPTTGISEMVDALKCAPGYYCKGL